MAVALDRLHPESALGWGAVAVGVAALVYGLSRITGASPPHVLAGFVAVGWIASVRWIYGLAVERRRPSSERERRSTGPEVGPADRDREDRDTERELETRATDHERERERVRRD